MPRPFRLERHSAIPTTGGNALPHRRRAILALRYFQLSSPMKALRSMQWLMK